MKFDWVNEGEVPATAYNDIKHPVCFVLLVYEHIYILAIEIYKLLIASCF